MRRPSAVERFWSKVSKQGDDACWLWTAATNTSGYGVFGASPRHSVAAHRFAWELAHGHFGPRASTAARVETWSGGRVPVALLTGGQ